MNNKFVSKELKTLEQELLLEKYKTALKKVQFINEIKSGLGADIKSNPNKVKVIKKSWYQKIVLIIKKIFTKF